MGYDYPFYGTAKPFVPASIDYPKKKARRLKSMLENRTLMECQQVIAKALGWEDWHALEQAIKEQRKPSLSDEHVDDDERMRRWSTQLDAISNARIHPADIEHIVASLGLTCSTKTVKKRLADIGPWGAFMEPPTEIAEGIQAGQCAKFFCFRLSPEREAQMPPHLRLDTGGWYMSPDLGWRVVISFKEHFSKEEFDQSMDDFMENAPLLYELETGQDPFVNDIMGDPSIATRIAAAEKNPDSYFALSNFPDWAIRPGNSIESDKIDVVSAVKGRDLLRLMATKGVWPTDDPINVVWFAMNRSALRSCVFSSSQKGKMANTCISGQSGWPHPPVCRTPFKNGVFEGGEIDFGSCRGFASLVDHVSPGNEIIIP